MNIESTERFNKERIENLVHEADLRVLLMCLVHITGDLSWLEPPYVPKRDIRLIPDKNAGLTEQAQKNIRNAVTDLLLNGISNPKINDPGDKLMLRMMSVSLGEKVPSEYALMVREELGFVTRIVDSDCTFETNQDTVIIVGAGFSSIALAVHLKNMNVPFVILERSNNLGGVWNYNRYPGCGVDTPNHSYSYSFGKRYQWSRYFSKREEILDYIHKITDEYDLNTNIQYNSTVESAVWNKDTQQWVISYSINGKLKEIQGRFFASAIGQLSEASIPVIEGQEQFLGTSFHSMHWPEGLSLAGKRIAVIGTGATSMQLVPNICDEAQQVDVYQRTPQWVRPIQGYSDNISDGSRWLLKHMPYYAEWFRFNMFWRYGDGLLACLYRDPEWASPDISVNKTNDRHRKEMVAFIRDNLHDRPDLLKKCVPDYPPYGKRILLDNNWYPTMKRTNVELITDGISKITPQGVMSTSGEERPTDIIVYATGFELTKMAARLNVSGLSGIKLDQVWSDGDPKAYLGVSVSGFPNFFMLIGPNSAPAHGGSVIFQAECQARYIASCISQMQSKKIGAIDIKEDVLDQHIKEVDAEHEKLVWTHPKVSTYYKNDKGRVFSVMPWRFVDYWRMTHEPRLENYIQYKRTV